MVFFRFTSVIFLFLFFSFGVSAQPYTNLVLEGAGIRGVAFVGAIQELEKQNVLPGIERVAGTSAGAIAALAICLGYTSPEIETIIYGTKLQKFNDGKFFFVGGISRMNRKYGWYRGKSFTRWLEKIIADKTGNSEITFRELHERKFRDLYVTGTSLNRQQLLVFSHVTYPDMKIKDAVRISISIPLYFEAVCIDSAGHVLDGTATKNFSDLTVDGGLTGNFPLFIFDAISKSPEQPGRIHNGATLGLRIDTPEQIAFQSEHTGLAPIEINRFRNYVEAFYNYILENLNRSTLTPEDWKRTISISSGSIGPKIKKLSEEQKNMLIENGRKSVQEYFQKTHP